MPSGPRSRVRASMGVPWARRSVHSRAIEARGLVRRSTIENVIDDIPMDAEDLRVAIYESFARTGRPPQLGPDAADALRQLHDQRHVVLGKDGQIVMAHPFATVPLGFSVMGSRTLWWGGCAWDSFALPHLVPGEPEVLVATTCPGCGAALAWNVGREAPPSGDELAH